MRFRGSSAGLWKNRAQNFLKIVSAERACFDRTCNNAVLSFLVATPPLPEYAMQFGCVDGDHSSAQRRCWQAADRVSPQQVEPCDIANYYRLKMDGGKPYDESRPECFWRLAEMCQYESREKAREKVRANGDRFAYVFTREWADHLQAGRDREQLPDPWKERDVRMSQVACEWCKPIAAGEVDVSSQTQQMVV